MKRFVSVPEGCYIPPVSLERLDDVAIFIGSSVPIAGAQLTRLLVQRRITSRKVSLRELLDLFRSADRGPPFRIIRRKGVEMAVPLGRARLATTLLSTAAHAVSSWGIATVHAVRDRVAALTSQRLSLEFASRALTSAPGFRWLDQARGWFSFADSGSRMAHVVQKVFSVSDSVRFEELRGAIVKALPMTLAVPAHVLREYLSKLCGCELRGRRVSLPRPARARLTPVERDVSAVLREAGGTLALPVLRAMLTHVAKPWNAIGRVLRSSPIFILTGTGRVRLVGAV